MPRALRRSRPWPLAFSGHDALLGQPNSLTHEFTQILALSTALSRVRFHDHWHSHATQLLASGIDQKIAQERLEHFSIAIALELYSHVLRGMREEAAAKVDAAMRAAIDKAAG